MLSLTEENYLKTIYHLSEQGKRRVLTNEIAASMLTRAASATDMIKKLAAKKLIYYEKYRGVQIISKGKSQALKVIRKHRLWETFLVNKLDFTWDQVHEVAEQLEHIRSPLLIEKLDAFLGYPEYDPHGDPIPDTKGNIKTLTKVTLSQLPQGAQGTIVAVKSSDTVLLKRLGKIGGKPGEKISVIHKKKDCETMEIALSGQKIVLSKEALDKIIVSGLHT